MKTKKIKRTMRRVFLLIMVLLLGTASWSLYQLLNAGVGSFLNIFGIQSIVIQNLIIVLSVLFLLIFSGFGIWKALEKLAKG